MDTQEWNEAVKAVGDEIREALAHEQTAYVRWEPNNGTAYELVITPWEAVAEIEEGHPTIYGGQMGPGWVWISNVHGKAVYPIRLWDEDGHLGGRVPHPDYLGEHLARRGEDGAALHLLLSAVAGCEPMCSLQEAGVVVADG